LILVIRRSGPASPPAFAADLVAFRENSSPPCGPVAILRLYSPTEAAIERSWKPGDIEKI